MRWSPAAVATVVILSESQMSCGKAGGDGVENGRPADSHHDSVPSFDSEMCGFVDLVFHRDSGNVVLSE
jgi:hypothetical protein